MRLAIVARGMHGQGYSEIMYGAVNSEFSLVKWVGKRVGVALS